MSFDKTQDLKNLLQAMKNAKLDCHTAILNDAHLTEGDFEELLNVEFVSSVDVEDDFEGKMLNYFEDSFYDTDSAFQNNVLQAVIRNFNNLLDSELNEALEENPKSDFKVVYKSELKSLLRKVSAQIEQTKDGYEIATQGLEAFEEELQGFLK